MLFSPPSPFFDPVERALPVGCVYLSVSPTNPAATFGFGTWAAIGAGRAIVGVDPADADFDAAEKTSGSKTHTLAANEMPSHTHLQNAHAHVENVASVATGGLVGSTPDTSTNTAVASGYSTASATAVNQNTGGGAAHNNVQPSFAIYIWKRTA